MSKDKLISISIIFCVILLAIVVQATLVIQAQQYIDHAIQEGIMNDVIRIEHKIWDLQVETGMIEEGAYIDRTGLPAREEPITLYDIDPRDYE